MAISAPLVICEIDFRKIDICGSAWQARCELEIRKAIPEARRIRMSAPMRARPKPTPETQHFWDGTKAGELR
ncbi:MAG: hypothetical protein QHD01_38340, partial [Bradyrhizobium sp.]|nr:hypothetical protein [Bradyrhizobium sp.]